MLAIKKEKIEEIRDLYKKGFSLREVAPKAGVCELTAFKYCKDILRNKSEAKKGKAPKNYKEFRKASNLYIYTEEHRKKLSETHKKLGTRPPSQKGAIPWNYRGVTPIHERIRKSPEYALWRKSIFIRDDYTCQICDNRGVNLRAHHIKKFSSHPDLRLEPTNGITICKDCDVLFVFNKEEKWEPFFYFNLIERGIFNLKDLPEL